MDEEAVFGSTGVVFFGIDFLSGSCFRLVFLLEMANGKLGGVVIQRRRVSFFSTADSDLFVEF